MTVATFTAWAMIINAWPSGAPAVVPFPYSTKEACIQAGNILSNQDGISRPMDFACIPVEAA